MSQKSSLMKTPQCVPKALTSDTQRLESLGKEVAPDDEVIVLLSGSTRDALPDEFNTSPAGSFLVKGKEKPVSVHQLLLSG